MILPLILLSANPGSVDVDPGRGIATIRDGSGKLSMTLDYSEGCIVSEATIGGRPVLRPGQGARTGFEIGGKWHTSAALSHPAQVSRQGNRLVVTGIEYGGGGLSVSEGWTFTASRDSIRWKIDRKYLSDGTLDGTAMPMATFASMSTWTGALLGTGGVAWGKLFDAPNATYGIHTGSATLWNASSDDCLRVSAVDAPKAQEALRFTREADGGFTMAAALTKEELRPKYGLARFERDRQDIWAPFAVSKSQTVSATYELSAPSFQDTYGRGDFKGLDTKAITELLNTIGRIGVIDEGHVGSNGWYSGYICMHEPWLARVGTAIDDANYRRTCGEWLDYARQHAILPDGMVKSRWKYDDGDAQQGTYDPNSGFYEAQWGRLMDSQTSYVTNVADQFDQSGDKAWVGRQKAACELALDYLLRRDEDHDGLVEMANDLTSQRRSSDWLDIVWAAHENAFVNAQLYGALLKWSDVEGVLGDLARQRYYSQFAAKLKASFNKTVSQGGFWDPEKGWYAYWRDADGSVHGDNLTTHVSLTALAEGLCDDRQRRRTLLDTIEKKMQAESLLAWPACFESFALGEGMNDVFPTYENGDIFLAWAEYGVRAYAATEPRVALKYVRQIVGQYKKDGLAYQRYLRASGKGAGDDILANNCNVITGLYRDIYGIQPKCNRLYLEPHLVPELDGTTVKYDLRGEALEIGLSVDSYWVRHKALSVKSSRPFGVDFTARGFRFFAGDGPAPSFDLDVRSGVVLSATVFSWGAERRWLLRAGSKPATALHTFHDLRPGVTYRLMSSGKMLGTISRTHPSVSIAVRPNRSVELRLVS